MKGKPSYVISILPRLRIMVGDQIALGPGKAELLGLICETSSISKAARRMEMSYMRAWCLVQTMNGCFREPIVLTKRGGQTGGGASLTKTGERLLVLYRRLEREFLAASTATRQELAALLKPKEGQRPGKVRRNS